MEDRAAPYVLAAGETRRDDAILPFKALASDTGGLLSVCEFTLGGWETGPVLHRHDTVDEAFYVVAGRLEAQLDDQRVQVAAGGFLWVPRGTAHTFANAGPDPVQVLALALPGGVGGAVRRAGGLSRRGPGPSGSRRARRDWSSTRCSDRWPSDPLPQRPGERPSRAALHLRPERHSAPLSRSLRPALGDDQDDAQLRPVATDATVGDAKRALRSAPSCPCW